MTTCLFSGLWRLALAAPLLPLAVVAAGQTTLDASRDESGGQPASLPNPLVSADGIKVTTIETWRTKRRPELLGLFTTNMYGRCPDRPSNMTFKVTSVDRGALSGKAIRKLVTVNFTGQSNGPTMDILIYLPNAVSNPVPVFAGLNFCGNHGVNDDPGIPISQRWFRQVEKYRVVNNRATEESRGVSAHRWPVDKLLARGFGLATVYYGDLEPDFAEGWKLGVRAALSKDSTETHFAFDEWGAISAWAWGLSRVMDYLESDQDIDARRVAVIGHSRLGKTALWAGAQDERFAIVISNQSGCGGAGLSRRWPGKTGEPVARMNRNFPHWMCANFKKFSNNEDALPVDQHELIALVAPRPVYVGSAEADQFTDPRSHFLAVLNAEPVFRLFGLKGLGVSEPPGVNQPVGDFIGYHMRAGKHELAAYDWDQYLAFAERHFGRSAPQDSRPPLK